MQSTNRIWFLQLARALACLMIIYIHWVAFIFQPNKLLKEIKQAPLLNYHGVDLSINFFREIVPATFSGGFFALGIFFLISGYVIPLTIENAKPLQFLARRLTRVFPTLIVCLCVTVFMVRLGRHLDHQSMHLIFKHKRLITNFLLIRDFFHQNFIENGTWTLEIELHFYLVCFLLAFVQGYKRALLILLSTLCILCAEVWQVYLLGSEANQYLGLNVTFISVMFMGTSLYNWNKKNWGLAKTLATILALLSINYFSVMHNPKWAEEAYLTFYGSIYALSAFAILLFVNDYLPYNKLLDKIAQASYPLYLVHGFVGYVTFFIAYKAWHQLGLALAVAVMVVVIATILIHKYIELPSIKLGKRYF